MAVPCHWSVPGCGGQLAVRVDWTCARPAFESACACAQAAAFLQQCGHRRVPTSTPNILCPLCSEEEQAMAAGGCRPSCSAHSLAAVAALAPPSGSSRLQGAGKHTLDPGAAALCAQSLCMFLVSQYHICLAPIPCRPHPLLACVPCLPCLYHRQVVLLGESSVGKSSLVLRFVVS